MYFIKNIISFCFVLKNKLYYSVRSCFIFDRIHNMTYDSGSVCHVVISVIIVTGGHLRLATQATGD